MPWATETRISRHPLLGFCIGLALTLGTGSALAQETQRYQAIAIPGDASGGPGGTVSSRVLILDSRDGHIWTWAENETIYEGETPRIGTVLIYQGKLRPGERPGEVLERHFP